MKLPMQALPVMRGQDRSQQMLPPHAVKPTVAQSQFNCSTICALRGCPGECWNRRSGVARLEPV